MPKKARPKSGKGRPKSAKSDKGRPKSAKKQANKEAKAEAKLAAKAAAEQAAAEALRTAREAVALALEEGRAAADGQDWERAIARFEAGLAVEGADDALTAEALQTAVDEAAAAMASRDDARSAAKQSHTAGLAAMDARDYPAAIAAFQQALALGEGERSVLASLRGRLALQSEELSQMLLGALAAAKTAMGAQANARREAEELAVDAEQALGEDNDRALAAQLYEQAASCDLNNVDLEESYRAKGAAVKAALEEARAAAQAKLFMGDGTVSAGHVEGLQWEAAIELYKEGLAVEGIQDEDLTAAMTEALARAEAGIVARGEARTAAALYREEGDAHHTFRDYPTSIKSWKAALALDTQSEALIAQLEGGLAAAETGFGLQEAARGEGRALAKKAEQAMVTKDHNTAIDAYEAASMLDLNDAKMTERYRAKVVETQAALAAARELAQANLLLGHEALARTDPEGKHWELSLDRYSSGLMVEGIQHAGLTAALNEALATAEAGRDVRDAARAAAAKHHDAGEASYTERDYPPAIVSFKAALTLPFESVMLTARLTQILRIAEAAQEAAELGPEGSPMSLDLLHAHTRVGRWRTGTHSEAEDTYAMLEQHEQKLLALFRDNQADLAGLRKRTSEGAKLQRADPWTAPELVMSSPNGEPLDFVPRMVFAVAVEGYCFKRGGQGCGYYRLGSEACAADSLYPLTKPLPFTAPENPHHAALMLTKRRPEVMSPGGVPKAAHETYVKVLAQELPVLPNGHVLLRGQIVSVSEIRRRRQDGALDAALTEWGWVTMRCPHTKRAWLTEVATTDGDLHPEHDLKGTAVSSIEAKQAVHEAGLREREHRGLAWQWEKSVAIRDRLEVPMTEHEKQTAERKEGNDRWLAEKLAARRRAKGLPDLSDSSDDDEASRRHPYWHEWRGVQHVEEHKEFHAPWQNLGAAGGTIAGESSSSSSSSTTHAVLYSAVAEVVGGGGRDRQPPPQTDSASSSSVVSLPAAINGSVSLPIPNGVKNDKPDKSYSYSKLLREARTHTSIALQARSESDLNPNVGAPAGAVKAHGRMEDSFDLSMSGSGGAGTLALHTGGGSHNTNLHVAALTLQVQLETASRKDKPPPKADELSYEEVVAADASILPYNVLKKMDSAKRLENAWSRIDTERDLVRLSDTQALAGDSTVRQRSRYAGRVNSRMAMCRAEARRKAGAVPPLSAAEVMGTGLGAVARFKALREEGSL